MRTLPQTRTVRLARDVVEKAGRDDLAILAAAGTYQMLLSLIPIVLLAASIVGFVFQNDPERAEQWIDQIATSVPGVEQVVGRSLDALVNARLQAGLIGLAVLLWTGSALAGLGAHALAKIFDVPERPWYRKRPMAIVELAVVGVAAAGAIVLTALVPAGAGDAAAIGAIVLGIVLDVVVFTLAYAVLTPPAGPPWRDHLPGALLMTLAWTILKLIGAWYTQYVIARATAVYGAIGAVFGILAILSLASNAFLYGAELSAVLRSRRRAQPPPDAGGGTARS